MGRVFQRYLDGAEIYSCANCKTHLASANCIVSKNFHGRTGTAYLFESVTNIVQGPSEDRTLMTGLHTVADIYCNTCLSIIGWKYVHAVEESQQYKEGKYVIELAKATVSD